jgi:hypothetical protein
MDFKKNIKVSVIFFCCIFICGCIRFPSLKQINLVIDYNGNQGLIESKMKRQASQFKHVLADLKHYGLRKGFSKEQMLSRYGEPVLLYNGNENSEVKEIWLYRDPLKYSNTDRVYLNFSRDSKLISWEYKPAEGDSGLL